MGQWPTHKTVLRRGFVLVRITSPQRSVTIGAWIEGRRTPIQFSFIFATVKATNNFS
ncbi:hypothetical protein SBA2_840026 [Acidobacteriia bacterium SbA2]|nr:hypothetical protein SBA2_840026 [Acidobacteriia bacterium SbA2]